VKNFVEDYGGKVLSFDSAYSDSGATQVESKTFVINYWKDKKPERAVYDDSSKSGIISSWYASWNAIPFSADEEVLKSINPGIKIEKQVTENQAVQEFIKNKEFSPPIVVVVDPEGANAVLASMYASYKNAVIVFAGGECNQIKDKVWIRLQELKAMGLQVDTEVNLGKREQFIVTINAPLLFQQLSCDFTIANPVFYYGRIDSSVLMMRGVFYSRFKKTGEFIISHEVEYAPYACSDVPGGTMSLSEYTSGSHLLGRVSSFKKTAFSSTGETSKFGPIQRYDGDSIENADLFVNLAHGGLLPESKGRPHSTIIINIGCEDIYEYSKVEEDVAAYFGTTSVTSLMLPDVASGINKPVAYYAHNNLVALYGDPTFRVSAAPAGESTVYGIDIDPVNHDMSPIKSIKYRPGVDVTRVVVTDYAGKCSMECPPAKASEWKECVFKDVSSCSEMCCVALVAYTEYEGKEIILKRGVNIKNGDNWVLDENYCKNDCSKKT
jgi:hypothetical protein